MENTEEKAKKILLTGFKGIGKSTIVKKVIKESGRNIYGFCTKKRVDLIDNEGFCPIYVFPAGKEMILDDAHMIGCGGQGTHYVNSEAFDTFGVEYLTLSDEAKASNPLIIMDEIGFMENSALLYRQKVMELLNGPYDVLAVLKLRQDIEFINQIKSIEGTQLITVTEENRDDIQQKLLTLFGKP